MLNHWYYIEGVIWAADSTVLVACINNISCFVKALTKKVYRNILNAAKNQQTNLGDNMDRSNVMPARHKGY